MVGRTRKIERNAVDNVNSSDVGHGGFVGNGVLERPRSVSCNGNFADIAHFAGIR